MQIFREFEEGQLRDVFWLTFTGIPHGASWRARLIVNPAILACLAYHTFGSI
jgi:hypothetical protein